jgi:hypothetical protein
MIGVQYVVKLVIEAVCGTPLAYAAVGFLKRRYGPKDSADDTRDGAQSQ